jgi:hypothetical protein
VRIRLAAAPILVARRRRNALLPKRELRREAPVFRAASPSE